MVHPSQEKKIYETNEAALARFCSQLTDIVKQVIIMTEVLPIRKDPEPYVRRSLLHKHTIDHSLISCTKENYYDLFSRQLASFERLQSAGICKVIHVEDRFLQDGIFYAYKDNQCHMMDDDHISNLGAILYARQYFNDWIVLYEKKD